MLTQVTRFLVFLLIIFVATADRVRVPGRLRALKENDKDKDKDNNDAGGAILSAVEGTVPTQTPNEFSQYTGSAPNSNGAAVLHIAVNPGGAPGPAPGPVPTLLPQPDTILSAVEVITTNPAVTATPISALPISAAPATATPVTAAPVNIPPDFVVTIPPLPAVPIPAAPMITAAPVIGATVTTSPPPGMTVTATITAPPGMTAPPVVPQAPSSIPENACANGAWYWDTGFYLDFNICKQSKECDVDGGECCLVEFCMCGQPNGAAASNCVPPYDVNKVQ
jgi:hypothetical protein